VGGWNWWWKCAGNVCVCVLRRWQWSRALAVILSVMLMVGFPRSVCDDVTFYMPILMLWMIWKIAEPQTTNMKRARSHGPTPFSSPRVLADLVTFPLWVMFLLCFSLAMRILCLATIFAEDCSFSIKLNLKKKVFVFRTDGRVFLLSKRLQI